MIQSFDITIRIHHFFDIIREFATKENIPALDSYKHSYHSVAHQIRDNNSLRLKLVLETDAVCRGCIYNIELGCMDTLTRKKGFALKNDYNDYLDRRILEACQLSLGQILTPKEICQTSDKYIQNMEYIYAIDTDAKTAIRKEEFIKGLINYSDWHSIPLNLNLI